MKRMEHPNSVANYFIDIGDSSLTPMKLQKLAYYAHGWHLGLFGEPLIDETVEAWSYGPVIPSLYHTFKRYGNQTITERAILEQEHQSISNPLIKELCNKIWQQYGSHSAITLSKMTHQPDTPWAQVAEEGPLLRGKDIPNSLIKEYFERVLTTDDK